MILNFIRKLLVILIILTLITIINQINLIPSTAYIWKTFLAIGFLTITSYAIGELFALLRFPKITGYFLSGLLFGINSELIFGANFFTVIDTRIAERLSFINAISISIIGLTAGLAFDFNELKKTWKQISYVLVSQFLFLMLILGSLVALLLAIFYPEIMQSFSAVSIISFFIVLLSLNTSIEVTVAIKNETGIKNSFVDFINNSTIIKNILIIILFSVSFIFINPAPIYPNKPILFSNELVKLFLSVIFGSLIGIIARQYFSFIKKEIALSIFLLILVFSEFANILHLDLLFVFISAGFVIRNFSESHQEFEKTIDKFSFIIFMIFFTYVGEVVNFPVSINVWLIALILFVFRIIAFYLSFHSVRKFGVDEILSNIGWTGYLSQSIMLIPLVYFIHNSLNLFGNEFMDIIISLILLNFFLAPIVLKFIIDKRFNQKQNNNQNHSTHVYVEDKRYNNSKFNEPQFEDAKLNKSLFNILFKLNDIVENFNKNFIHQRSEESIELVISATESYTDDYIKLKSALSKPNLKPEDIYSALLDAKQRLSRYYIDLVTERIQTEKNILKLEPLIKDLFISLIDLVDSLQKKIEVDMEINWLYPQKDDSFKAKVFKFKYRFVQAVNSYFNPDYRIKRTIDYRNLAKYYLVGQSASEILETVNLVGAERLNTLRQIRRLFQDYSNYLDELLILSHQEKGNKELSELILSKMEKIHSLFVNEIKIYNQEISNTTEELSSRLIYSLATPFNKFLDAIRVAGTYNSKEKKLKFSKIYAKSEAAKDFAMETVRYWMNYYIGFLGLFKKDAVISELKVGLNKIVQENLLVVLYQINSNLNQAFAEINLILEKYGHEIEENISSSGSIAEFIDYKKNELILPVINKYIANLEELKQSRKLKFFAEIIMHEFSELANELPDFINLLEESDFRFKDRRPVFAGLRKAIVREIAASYLQQRLPREISEINELIINHLNVSLDELKNLFSIVNYHSQNILQSELENKGSNEMIVELAYSLVEKIDHRINQLNQQIDRLAVNINKKVLERVNTSVDTIEKLLLESSIAKSSLQLEALEGKEKLVFYTNKVIHLIKLYLFKIYSISKKAYALFIRDRVKQILIGLDVKVNEEEKEPESLLLNEEKLKGLPFIYRKLFDGSPLESNDFFVKNELLVNKINNQLQKFKDNKNSSTLIIGEPGSGKKTLINSIKNTFLINQNLIHLQISETITSKSQLINILAKELGMKRIPKFDELILTLNDKSNKKIIIIETLGKLYFKSVDGYEAIKSLLFLVSATNNNVFWLCSIGKLPYQFLNSNFDLAKLFSEKIFINELHKTELKSILLSRHSATGYDLKYLPDDISAFKRKIISRKNFLDDQKLLEDNYFEKLEEYSGGNIISAMFYWLQSINSVDGNTIIIKPPRKITLEYIKALNDNYLLTLAQLLYHGSLSDAEHQKLFALSIEESKEILNYLKSLNLIYQDTIDYMNNRYFINKFAYKIIEDELKKRNMI